MGNKRTKVAVVGAQKRKSWVKQASLWAVFLTAVIGIVGKVLTLPKKLDPTEKPQAPSAPTNIEFKPNIQVTALVQNGVLANSAPAPILAGEVHAAVQPHGRMEVSSSQPAQLSADPSPPRKVAVEKPDRPSKALDHDEVAQPPAQEIAALAVGGRAVVDLLGASYTRFIFDKPGGSQLSQKKLEQGTEVTIKELRSGWAQIVWTDSSAPSESSPVDGQCGWVKQNLLNPK